MKCEQELCPAWTGDGCACAVMGLDPDTCPLCKRPVHDYRCGAWPS